jgi:hypothetical protein
MQKFSTKNHTLQPTIDHTNSPLSQKINQLKSPDKPRNCPNPSAIKKPPSGVCKFKVGRQHADKFETKRRKIEMTLVGRAFPTIRQGGLDVVQELKKEGKEFKGKKF